MVYELKVPIPTIVQTEQMSGWLEKGRRVALRASEKFRQIGISSSTPTQGASFFEKARRVALRASEKAPTQGQSILMPMIFVGGAALAAYLAFKG